MTIKIVSVLFLAMFVFSFTPAQAAEPLADSAPLTPDGGYGERIAEKIGRGIENFFFGWMEIPNQVRLTKKEKGVLQASTVGVGKGLVYTIMRMGVGLYEIVSFPYAQDPIMPAIEEWS